MVLYYKLLLPPLLLASNKNMVRLVQGNVVNICIGSETGLPEVESRPRGATVARLTPDQKVACSNHVGVKKRLLFHGLFNNKRSQRRLSNKKSFHADCAIKEPWAREFEAITELLATLVEYTNCTKCSFYDIYSF